MKTTLAICMLAWLLQLSEAIIELDVEIEKAVLRTLRPDFLSIGLDSSIVRHGWCNIDWRLGIAYARHHKKAIRLTRSLGPATLRFGGNDADRMIYDPDAPQNNSSDCLDRTTLTSPFTFNNGDWRLLHNFVRQANLRLVFDLNALLRTAQGDWDPSNARKLLAYSQQKGLSFHLELGNEPNAWRHKFGRPVSPERLAADFRRFRKLRREFPAFADAHTIGPSISSPAKGGNNKFLRRFLAAAPNVSVATFHHYYISGWTANESQFLDPGNMEPLGPLIRSTVKEVRNLGVSSVWLGETASAYGAGAPGLSDSYLNGFFWLNKLGMAALGGLDVVIRQSIFKGDYALLDQDTNPNPDYFLSLLYKKVVGPDVHSISTGMHGQAASYVRLFAHSSNDLFVVYGMNLLSDEPVVLNFSAMNTREIYEYQYEPTAERLTSRHVLINGKKMGKTHSNSPQIPPARLVQGKPTIGPRRIAFFLLKS